MSSTPSLPSALDVQRPVQQASEKPKLALATVETGRQQSKKKGNKLTRDERIDQLIAERNRDRERIAELLSERQSSDAELARLRSIMVEREAQQRTIPERIAQALAQGRAEWTDFDEVVRAVQVDRPSFEALLASANGADLMYAAGVGMVLIQRWRGFHNQAQADRERVEHYRQLHQQHFAEQVNHGQ